MITDEYLAMKELGLICGLSQKRMGLALDRLELWIVGDGPTQEAFNEGYIHYRTYPHRPDIGDRALPLWHKEKTLAALKTIGIVPLPEFAVPTPVPTVPPAMPFPTAYSRPPKPSYMDKHG